MQGWMSRDTRQSDQKKALIHLSHAFRRSCSVEANTHWEIRSGVSRFRSCRVDQFEGILMCGRYVRRSDKQRIAELFAVHGPVIPDFGPSWNVAPQTFQPVVRLNRDTGEREIVLMRWGLFHSGQRIKKLAFARSTQKQRRSQRRLPSGKLFGIGDAWCLRMHFTSGSESVKR